MKLQEPQTEVEFESYYDLRWRILREPLGLPRGSEKDHLEDQSFHLSAQTEEGKIVGVAKFKPSTPKIVQISHIAVEDSMQGKGVGKMLIAALEKEARQRGCTETFLTARIYSSQYKFRPLAETKKR